MPDRILKLTVTDDGGRFVGWQRQPTGESVQGLLEEALGRFEGRPVTVHGAGRTDAGVHALGQVASARITTDHDAEALTRGLNAALPRDVRVLRVEDAPPRFHARFSARVKHYRYLMRHASQASPFDRAFVWDVAGTLDLDAMRVETASLVGPHDFGAFQSAGTDVSGTIRTIHRAKLMASAGGVHTPAPDGVVAFEVSADGFLRHMVRALVGTLVEVGLGRRPPGALTELLGGGRRAEAGPTAPSHGLFLVGVDYD